MRYFIVDAFAEGDYRGNPAGVCLPDAPLTAAQMRCIAAENNLPETAFVMGRKGIYDIRWFDAAGEVDLCGHATLASAWVLSRFVEQEARSLTFSSKSGALHAVCENDAVTLDFPVRPAKVVPTSPELPRILGVTPQEIRLARDWVAVLDSEQAVRGLKPDFAAMARLAQGDGVIVTARGADCDYVCRCFYPKSGVNEDPVTGSAQCNLAPYWAERFGKNELTAHQLSARGGVLHCTVSGNRVRLRGKARLYLSGEISAAYLE